MPDNERRTRWRRPWSFVVAGSLLAVALILLLTWTHLLVAGARHGNVSCMESLLSRGAEGRGVIADRVIPGNEHHVITMIELIGKASDKDAAFYMLAYIVESRALVHWCGAYPFVVGTLAEIGALGRFYERVAPFDPGSYEGEAYVPQIGAPLLGHLIPLLNSLEGKARTMVWYDVTSVLPYRYKGHIVATGVSDSTGLDLPAPSVYSKDRWREDPEGVVRDLTAWWKKNKAIIHQDVNNEWRTLIEENSEEGQ